MKTWNIGNTTVRNPYRLRAALQLFQVKMGGRPFGRGEQQEYLNELVAAGLVDSDRAVEGDDGGRKFASAFKQLGFVTDWSRSQPWQVTPVGQLLIQHVNLEEMIFLRQLLKYQIPSLLESGSRVQGFHVRPYRLLLRFLKRAREENLGGLTKVEIALYVINVLDENDPVAFEEAITKIKQFRDDYTALTGKVNKSRFANQKLAEVASRAGLMPDSLMDYADSNGRYALITGLLTTRGKKLALAESRLPIIEAILADGTTLIPQHEYLPFFYDPVQPQLPTDDVLFLQGEAARLEQQCVELAAQIEEPVLLPSPPAAFTLLELQAYEKRLRDRLRDIREIQFYRQQSSPAALDEIEDLLEDIKGGVKVFFGGSDYAPALFEWLIWRLFLAINEIAGSISATRRFPIDEDINPTHHAKSGYADLLFTYKDFKLVCEMTLTSGSRQFAAEGEPVTRHVFDETERSAGLPVYGLFVAKKLDPNTADAFHKARYWRDRKTYVQTPVIALEIGQVLKLIQVMRTRKIAIADFRLLLERMLQLQETSTHGPAWYEACSLLYEEWLLHSEDAQ